jgi:mRNA-degrading endonuclease toxin of MazEF toxin-antitoxin module
MTPGDVVLIRLPATGSGAPELRPALVLARLPGPYQNVLLSGISTQVQFLVPDWDELVQSADSDFAHSGLHRPSAVRLSYLYAADPSELAGTIGSVAAARLARLRGRLASHLQNAEA